ncbi:Mobilization protein A [compost metagenome]
MRFSARNARALRGKSNSQSQSRASMSNGYRANARRGSRKGGQSASAKHAYHERLDGYAVGCDGVRDDLFATGCGNLPAFAQGDPAAFWLAADQFERANAALFVDLQFNLPTELTLEQQIELVRGYGDRMFDRLSLPYTWAAHSPDSENPNPHLHLMVSERMNDGLDRPAEQHFRRYNPKKPERGGAQKTRELQPKSWLMEARAAWAEEVNRALVATGHPPRFDHRSKKDRLAEALDLGNWRLAAELITPTETHEGPRIGGYRKRLRAERITWDQVPPYAQRVIEANDEIRAFSRQHLEMIAGMSDDELRLMLADEIVDRARERLTLAERGELAEFEVEEQASHQAALQALQNELPVIGADELAELLPRLREQHAALQPLPAEADPQPVRRDRRAGYQERAERYVAEEFASWDAVPRIARARLQARQIEVPALQATRERAAHLEEFLASPPPPFVAVAEQLRGAAERAGRTLLATAQAAQAAAQAAQEWHAANRLASAAARFTGKRPAVDEAAARAVEQFEVARRVEQRAMAAYEAAPEVAQAARYTKLRAALQRELEGLHASLSALVVEAAQERSPELQRLWALPDADLDTDTRLDDEQRGRDQPEPDDLDLGDGEEWGEIDLGDDDLDDDPTPTPPRNRGPRMG